VGSSLDLFAPATRDWFLSSFAGPTPVQERGWHEVASGRHVLMAAHRQRKTLAAFPGVLTG
jgi:ATP-dependent Lhr-like helicase